MKKKTLSLIKIILKYVLPVILGWLEGDTHAVADALDSIIQIF